AAEREPPTGPEGAEPEQEGECERQPPSGEGVAKKESAALERRHPRRRGDLRLLDVLEERAHALHLRGQRALRRRVAHRVARNVEREVLRGVQGERRGLPAPRRAGVPEWKDAEHEAARRET